MVNMCSVVFYLFFQTQFKQSNLVFVECVCVCVFLSPFDRALEVWLADGVVVDEDCGTGAVLL